MPMIDVYVPAGLIRTETEPELCSRLTYAVLKAEGVTDPTESHLSNTAAFIHTLASSCVGTAATPNARVARIEILTPPSALTREGQKQIVSDATAILKSACVTPPSRIWVLLKSATEGGWGISGKAYGLEEFRALLAKAP